MLFPLKAGEHFRLSCLLSDKKGKISCKKNKIDVDEKCESRCKITI